LQKKKGYISHKHRPYGCTIKRFDEVYFMSSPYSDKNFNGIASAALFLLAISLAANNISEDIDPQVCSCDPNCPNPFPEELIFLSSYPIAHTISSYEPFPCARRYYSFPIRVVGYKR
jgi:hypothetical protein